jgi:hypothetical protein
VDLARLLSEKRADFALRAEINLPECLVVPMPMTLVAGFALFDPFFSELRHPQELKKLRGVCKDERSVLDALVFRLQPFLSGVRGRQIGAVPSSQE